MNSTLYATEQLEATALARKVLDVFFKVRNLAGERQMHGNHTCAMCYTPHLDRLTKSIMAGEKLRFVLAAFPAKSPNPAKTLGWMPDMAEWLALDRLKDICDQVKRIYAPGLEIIIASDGQVFNDLIEVPDLDVMAYQLGLATMMDQIGATDLTLFNLDDTYGPGCFDSMRIALLEEHGDSTYEVERKISRDPETARLFNGIYHGLMEDAARSRKIKNADARKTATEYVRRIQAWTSMVAETFPGAIQLSARPQLPHGRALGIRLVDATQPWLTPWNAVALQQGEGYVLIDRSEAEAMNAVLVREKNRPHYVMPGTLKQAV